MQRNLIIEDKKVTKKIKDLKKIAKNDFGSLNPSNSRRSCI
jgi:hypothetical protein